MLYNSPYERLKEIVRDKKFPLALCDLDAFNQNLENVGKFLREKQKSLRLCTKSVRVPDLIKKVEEKDFVNGLFTFNSAETLFYAEKYKIKDILLGYPIMSKVDAEELCQAAQVSDDMQITVMVDHVKHLDLLETAASKNKVLINALIDVDVADKFLGINVGVFRSPLRDPKDVVSLAREIEKREHLNYKGIMGYEAQNASLGDDKALIRWLKKRSRKNVDIYRQNVVEELTNAGFKPEIVNGGGSGCFEETAVEKSITEIGIGSLLFKSHIFDPIESLRNFIPSMFFVIQIVRKPRNNIATAFSGGYVSSGSIRAIPKIIQPENLESIKDEAFGEVQTPLKFNPKKVKLDLGDPIICRFGKAGEPMEHFTEVHIFTDGKIVDKYLTYRGFGKQFS